MSIASSKAAAAYTAAFREGKEAGLNDVPALWHAWATYWLALLGFDFPARPDIISGFRSPEKQRRLLNQWRAGNRAGLRSKPACRSWHTVGQAWDVETDVQGFEWYAFLLDRVDGLRDGRNFGDVGHFDIPTSSQPPSICSDTVS